MTIKIENISETKLPRNVEIYIKKILEIVPREHLRGLERLRLVNKIIDSRLRNLPKSEQLPGLYHPRQGGQPAWIEVSTDALLPRTEPFLKRLLPRLSFRGNLAAIIFSLIAQHYYLTLRHSVKRRQIEPFVREYTEKYLRIWNENEHSLRMRFFRPLQPTFEKWARSLKRQAASGRKKAHQ